MHSFFAAAESSLTDVDMDKKEDRSKRSLGGSKRTFSAPALFQTPPNPFDGLEDETIIEDWDALNVILIRQHVDAVTGFETKFKYDLMGPESPKAILTGTETSNCCQRGCLGNSRGFLMSIYDVDDEILFNIKRKCGCGVCLVPCSFLSCAVCCKDQIVVKGKDGKEWGTIRGGWACFRSLYYLHDESGEIKYKVKGPCCVCSTQVMGQLCACTVQCCCKRGNFKVYDYRNGRHAGTIFKKQSSINKEIVTLTDMIGIEFPHDCDTKMKAVLIAMVFLIDMKHFEKYD